MMTQKRRAMMKQKRKRLKLLAVLMMTVLLSLLLNVMEPTTSVCPQHLVLDDAVAIHNAIRRLHLGNESGAAPVHRWCRAGLLHGWLLHRYCCHALYCCLLGRHHFLVLDCWLLHRRHSGLWTDHRCLLELHLATDCRGRARLGRGPLMGAAGVGPGSVGLSFFNAGFCTGAAAL